MVLTLSFMFQNVLVPKSDLYDETLLSRLFSVNAALRKSKLDYESDVEGILNRVNFRKSNLA
jgi:hypothetical protein